MGSLMLASNSSQGYLIGAILGDALQAERYDGVVELLKKHQFQELCEARHSWILTRLRFHDLPMLVTRAQTGDLHCFLSDHRPERSSRKPSRR